MDYRVASLTHTDSTCVWWSAVFILLSRVNTLHDTDIISLRLANRSLTLGLTLIISLSLQWGTADVALKHLLLRTHSNNSFVVVVLKPGVGQNLAMRASSTASSCNSNKKYCYNNCTFLISISLVRSTLFFPTLFKHNVTCDMNFELDFYKLMPYVLLVWHDASRLPGGCWI